MGKKKEGVNLGRTLMKEKFGRNYRTKNSLLHTSEIEDGQNYNRINFNSITEQNEVDSFLATAELAGNDFKAEKLNIKFIRPSSTVGIITKEERNKVKLLHECHKDLLRIPRRPLWDRSMSSEELSELERETFLKWRRSLVFLQETEGILMTPYEKNLEFWRQLWRVIERSDVVVQIVDARNPLLFHCEDLLKYVKEVNPNKENLILANKADFLTDLQKEEWADYFQEHNINAVFFSATDEDALDDIEEDVSDFSDNEVDDFVSCCSSPSIHEEETERRFDRLNLEDGYSSQSDSDNEKDITHARNADVYFPAEETLDDLSTDISATNFSDKKLFSPFIGSAKLLSRRELIEVFRSFKFYMKPNSSYVTIGLVGYPNVGKSSTINSLIQEKKVSVSATPGKTKHFQTLFLSDDVLLCDCPGLVFPEFVCTKEEMIVSGILPIDQMRDHVPPTNLVLSLIPRSVLESMYGVSIPKPLEGEDVHRYPTSEEFLGVYGYMRGFMTPRGIPDHPRSARYILKDYLIGKLLYSHAPPGISQEDFHTFTLKKERKIPLQSTAHQRSSLPRKKDSSAIDASFFDGKTPGLHIKGGAKMKHQGMSISSEDVTVTKPWRIAPKRNTKQKTRIKYAHLDQ